MRFAGRIEFQNENLADLVIVRSDGRATYNFASPVEDMLDGITHVIRGNDHVSNTPTQINILTALGATLPVYAHLPDVNGNDGKKLSKRHGAVAIDAFREDGYVPAALMNFLALLGWSFDDKTTVMSPEELVERFSLARVGPSPATFDYQKLDWLNGVHLRELSQDAYATALLTWLGERGIAWPEERVRETVPLVQEKIEKFSQYPDFVRFLFQPVSPGRRGSRGDAGRRRRARGRRPVGCGRDRGGAAAMPPRPRGSSRARRSRRFDSGSPGSKVSPGLFESLELLGREESLARLRAVEQ